MTSGNFPKTYIFLQIVARALWELTNKVLTFVRRLAMLHFLKMGHLKTFTFRIITETKPDK